MTANSPAPRIGGASLRLVAAILQVPVLGPALARRLSRDVVDARLRHPDLLGGAAPAPLYAPAPAGPYPSLAPLGCTDEAPAAAVEPDLEAPR